MNYANHTLRTNLQEWKNRLYKAQYEQFGFQLKYILDNLNSNKQTSGILREISISFKYENNQLRKYFDSHGRDKINYSCPEEQAAFCFQFLMYFVLENSYDLHKYSTLASGSGSERRQNIIEKFITPIINVLHDKLDNSNSVIYLLEKYKKRTEWFTKEVLLDQYNSANKNYEQILEDDLRLFLFDQGIEYPFSTPSSSSGRADIIGEIDTEDPIIIEVKIFDSTKGYRKERIISGFTQAVKYANDYNKDVGYLVLYNLDNLELNFKLSGNSHVFPPSIHFNNKTFYFIVINLGKHKSASKTGTLKELAITECELTKKTL